MTHPAPARLLGLATALPEHVLDQAEVARVGLGLFDATLADRVRARGVYANAAIATRHSCVPLSWYLEPHGFAERNDLYLRHAVELGARAAAAVIERSGLALDDIDGIVAVSTSGVATPSLDALLVERLPFRRDVERLPVFGLGCAGGVLGLARAGAMALARPGSRVLLVVVELCGLTFRHGDRSKSNLIASALFGDGAAACIVSTEGTGAVLRSWGEHTWPGSLDVMGWRVMDDGLGVLFSRDIPALIRGDLRAVAERFLAKHGLGLDAIDAFLCHPGGAKVVDALEEAFGLVPGALEDSRAVLLRFGNMSAVTVLFVLARALERGQRGRLLLSSLGPGFTAAFLIAEAA
ncbi:MAG: type III polyketide synthase [Alphaproteobacteria bacterium]